MHKKKKRQGNNKRDYADIKKEKNNRGNNRTHTHVNRRMKKKKKTQMYQKYARLRELEKKNIY